MNTTAIELDYRDLIARPYTVEELKQNLLRDLEDAQTRQVDISVIYSAIIETNPATVVSDINRAIIKRWSRAGLKRIKQMAWSGEFWNIYMREATDDGANTRSDTRN